jgi:hypothetical protein
MKMSSLKTIRETRSYAWRFELMLLGSVEDREDALDEVSMFTALVDQVPSCQGIAGSGRALQGTRGKVPGQGTYQWYTGWYARTKDK